MSFVARMGRGTALAIAVSFAAQAQEPSPGSSSPPSPLAVNGTAELPPIAGAGQLAPTSSSPNSLPPVSGQLFKLGGRLELEPMFAISLGDPFYRTYAAGARAEQHLDERWSLAVHLLAGASTVSAPVELCGGAPCYAPARDQLRSTPGQLQLMTGLEVSWAPIYGKLSLIGQSTVHFDTYLSLGPELIRERIAADAASPVEGRWDVGARGSIGERLFLTDRFVVRVALSELVYGARVRGRTEVERKLAFEGGLAWFFGAGR